MHAKIKSESFRKLVSQAHLKKYSKEKYNLEKYSLGKYKYSLEKFSWKIWKLLVIAFEKHIMSRIEK